MKHLLKLWRKRLTGHFPIYLEFGTTPGDTPPTPPEHREAARAALELLLSGWTDAVAKADVSDHRRKVVADTVARVRGALTHHTTPNNLICTVLAPAFLLPGEPEVTGMMSADLEELGAVFKLPTTHIYPSLFDNPEKAGGGLPFLEM